MQNLACETHGEVTKKKKHFIRDDVLELFMHSNKLGGKHYVAYFTQAPVCIQEQLAVGLLNNVTPASLSFYVTRLIPYKRACALLLCVSVCVAKSDNALPPWKIRQRPHYYHQTDQPPFIQDLG